MIDDKSDSNDVDPGPSDDAVDEISKSQRKRDADAIRELGAHLADLGATELATIPLPDDVLSAIHELQRIKAHGARKRQLGFLAKRLRQIDIEPVDAALEKLRQAARANTINLHRVEQWRDRLLGEVENESEKDALTAFLGEYVHADRQQFRHLQRQALAERKSQRPPAASRQLFKAIRDVVIPTPGND
ncbi:ribosome biogenesis factor YjgA [Granulosicoccus sp. 3-233]|uniref:ribosome biogenesis factor YjgA n=1 Tax=Granulosicoccus sp. 3-233 TaxID=3417969 RepID=UPI003D33AB90